MARPKIKRRSQVSDGSRWEPATLKEAAIYYDCYIVAMAGDSRSSRCEPPHQGHPVEGHPPAIADLNLLTCAQVLSLLGSPKRGSRLVVPCFPHRLWGDECS